MKTFLFVFFVIFSYCSESRSEISSESRELVIYTSRQDHLLRPIINDYQKETGVKVTIRPGDDGALIQTIKSEGGKSPADIFMTVDAGNLWNAANQGIFTPFESQKIQNAVPAPYRDKDNLWTGLSLRLRTLVYSSERVKKGELTSYEDLAAPKWKGRLCLRTSKKVYNQSLVAMLISTHGKERAKQIVKGWVDNAVAIFPNDNKAMEAVASGQCDVTIVNTYYFAKIKKDNPELKIDIFWPNQETDGVHVNISGAGIVKTSKNKKLATEFLEWLVTKEGQTRFANINYEFTLNPKEKQAPIVEAWGKFKYNETFHLTDAGRLQAQAIKIMSEVNYR